jgi:L-threonylcarbamoyladenylate synthase
MTETLVLAPDAAGIARAAALLRAGGLVAFPTETVYGLGANALDAEAVAGIFRAKGRPAEDPLIVHLAAAADLPRVVRAVPRRAERLAAAFWPGPLTLVLPRTDAVPAAVTAGLDTVGVRVPAHPVAHALLAAAGVPVAAPSANLFSRPSPTRAAHVLADLRGRIDAVLDGGPTPVGVESTIVDLSAGAPRLLRPGGVPAEAIEALLGEALDAGPHPATNGGAGVPQVAPGLLETHYAPRTPLVLVADADPARARAHLLAEVAGAVRAGRRVGVLALDEDRADLPPGVVAEPVGAWDDPAASAARLFHALRALDAAGLETLYARPLAEPSGGLGRALADRLLRAAARRV